MTKNYLNKKVENVTAPREWQSGPDSPPTKLAYVTQPEIDLLVKANIHGSMQGKPNKGPKGIMSLDGADREERISDKSFGKQMGVTLDTSKAADRAKRQSFRDRTGSTVVTEREARDRIEDEDITPSFVEDVIQSQARSAPQIYGDFFKKRYGFDPSQQYKFSLENILKDGTAFTNIMSMASTIFGNDVVGQSMLEKFKTAIEEGKNIQEVIDNFTNKEYKEYIQLQSKLDNTIMPPTFDEPFQNELTGAFLNNTLKIDGEDTGIRIGDILDRTSEGIFSLDDPLVKNVQMQLANNPDLTFLQSIGIGTPDEFMNQTEALKALGPRAAESLKVLNPEKYYGTIEEGGFGFRPTTNQELENLAKMDIGAAKAAGNKGLVNAIAAARMELNRNRGGGDNQQAGIPSVVPPPVTPPGAPQPPVVPFPPIAGLPTFPGLTPGAPQFNYGAFPQFNLSTYAQQGIANPDLAAFYQNLGRIA
tara:strand:- start:1021 stop:2448 length:1428 start_codon:yes stop_codon:yes gene_type:complete